MQAHKELTSIFSSVPKVSPSLQVNPHTISRMSFNIESISVPSLPILAKKKKKPAKQCRGCLCRANSNKQKFCKSGKCPENFRDWIKTEPKAKGKGKVCRKPGCGWSTRGNRAHKCGACGTPFRAFFKKKAYNKSGAASKKRKATTQVVDNSSPMQDYISNQEFWQKASEQQPASKRAKTTPESPESAKDSNNASISVNDFDLDKFEAELKNTPSSPLSLTRENSLLDFGEFDFDPNAAPLDFDFDLNNSDILNLETNLDISGIFSEPVCV